MHFVVIGLMERQQQIVLKKYPGVRFRFARADVGHKAIGGGSHIFLMLRFLNHSRIGEVRSLYAKEKVHRIMGGLSQLFLEIERAIYATNHQTTQGVFAEKCGSR